jgi:phage regulator Rha-like protein
MITKEQSKGNAKKTLRKTGVVKFSAIEERIITLRGEKVLLDSDVAELYGVETRDINKSVKNNPDKFPDGYIFYLDKKEFTDLRWKISTANIAKTRTLPKAFTEKGLYMLATILKSPQATQTTIAIVETFAKIRELARTVVELSAAPEEFKQKSWIQKGGDIIGDLLGDNLQVSGMETKYEFNLALFKVTHTVKKTSKT